MAITRTTPAAIIGDYSSESPFSFAATVPAGGLIAVFSASAISRADASDTYHHVAISDSGSHTWRRRATVGNLNTDACESTIWLDEWYNDTGASVSMTISVSTIDLPYNPRVAVVAQVLTGVKNPANYNPQTFIQYNMSAPNLSLVPSGVGSQVIAGFALKAATTTISAANGNVIDTSPAAQLFIAGDGIVAGAVARTALTGSVENSIVVGGNATVDSAYSMIAVEYQDANAVTMTASIGGDASIATDGTAALTASGSGSSMTKTYTWSITSGNGTLLSNTGQNVKLTSSAPGATVVKCDVRDGNSMASATFTVRVFENHYRLKVNGVWTNPRYMSRGQTGFSEIMHYGISRATTSTADGRAYTNTILGDGPSLYYAMQEQGGKVAADWSGNGKHGQYVGEMEVDMASNRYLFPEPALGRCVATYNDAADGQYIAAVADSVDVTNGITIELWARVRGWGWNNHLADISNVSGESDIEVVVDASGLSVWVSGRSFTAPAISLNEWHHVVVTISAAGSAIVYVDGKQTGAGTVGALVAQGRPTTYFGRAAGASNYINGYWTQCALYDKILSAAQVNNHYTVGVSDQDPVWHGAAEWYNPASFSQWEKAAWLNDPNRVFFGDWMPSYGDISQLSVEKDYYDVGFCQHYWSTLDGAAYVNTVAQYATEAVANNMRMIPDWYNVSNEYNGPDAIGFAGPDEADMHDPADVSDNNNYPALLRALDEIKTAGQMGYVNYGTLITLGQGSPLVPPTIYANLDFHLWTADLYFYSVGDQTYDHLNSYWGLTRDQCRRACNYGALIERQRSFLSSPKPIWGIIDLAHPNDTPDAGGPNPDQVEGAVWGSIIGGARGIEWFHHSFIGTGAYPAWSATTTYAVSSNVQYNGKYYYAALPPTVGVAPSDSSYTWVRYTNNSGANISVESARHPDLLPRIKKIRTDVNSIAAAIYSPTVPHLCHKSIYSTYRPQALDGKHYIIAIPGLAAPNGGTFSMYLPKGQTPASIEVVGESRTITPSAGKFTDTFAAEYTHHIYRW